jgi:hypothetical protein
MMKKNVLYFITLLLVVSGWKYMAANEQCVYEQMGPRSPCVSDLNCDPYQDPYERRCQVTSDETGDTKDGEPVSYNTVIMHTIVDGECDNGECTGGVTVDTTEREYQETFCESCTSQS